MRRSLSTFTGGWAGMGLLLMRLAGGIALIQRGIVGLRGEPQLGAIMVHVLATVAGTLLVAGLWTPFAGTLAAVIELWCIFAQSRDPLVHVLLLTLGAALALVGPGAWSVDARLFGWKRIDIRTRKS